MRYQYYLYEYRHTIRLAMTSKVSYFDDALPANPLPQTGYPNALHDFEFLRS